MTSTRDTITHRRRSQRFFDGSATGSINAVDWGVKANGVTDDLTALQAAISSLTSGGVVHLPRGTIIISAKLTLPSDVTLIGAGSGVTIIQAQTALTTAMMSPTNNTDQFLRCGLKKLSFDNKTASVGSVCIDWTNVSVGVIRDVSMSSGEIGLLLDTNNSKGCFYNNVQNLNSASCTTAIKCDSVANENHFFGGKHGMTGTSTGIHVNDCNSNKFYGISIEGTFTHGFLFGTTAARNHLLSGLRFEGGTNGITTDTGYSNDSVVISPLFTGLTTDINNTTDTGLMVVGQDHAGDELWSKDFVFANSNAGGTKHTALARIRANSAALIYLRNAADNAYADAEMLRCTARRTGKLAFEGTQTDAGITFGNDTNWYRSAADIMATDDDVLIAGAGKGIEFGAGGPKILFGSATPESAVTADVGSIFMRTDGGAGTSVYVKETGTGNTGWVGK